MLRILTLNIGSLFEADWTLRQPEIVAWVDQLAPDVICLQEVWESSTQTNTAQLIADAATGDWHMAFGGYPFGRFGEDDPAFKFGSAILSRWPIDDHQVHALPVADDPGDPIPASVPWELVSAETAGLSVFTTHLAPAPVHGRHRRLQVLAIVDHIAEVRGNRDRVGRDRDPMPPILCGDFNAEPESDEIRFLKGLTPFDDRTFFMQDSWAVAGDAGPGYTQDWRTHPLAAELNVHRKRIDYVFVGDPFLRSGKGGRVTACRVVAAEPLTGIQASDHMGVLAEVAWPNRPR